MTPTRVARVATLGFLLLFPGAIHAETGRAGWLRYAAVSADARVRYAGVPRLIVRLDDALVVQTAAAELSRGLDSMLGGTTSIAPLDRRPAIVLGTLPRVRTALRGLADRNRQRDPDLPAVLAADSFWIGTLGTGAQRRLVIAGGSDRGVLYGVFSAAGMKEFNASCLVGAAVGAVVGVGLWTGIRGFAARA